MYAILAAIILLAIVTYILFWYGELGCASRYAWATILATISGGCTIFSVVCYLGSAYSWFAAEHKTNIINREYGTSYTQEEVFYASDVINTVRELYRQRLEISINNKK